MASEEIVRFFIEEGKEHLDTLERGLLDLKAAVKDSEMVNEMFRAAHSVKGGAAMLGFSSIQKTAHRLEDYFKILKDNPVPVDQKLESLFLKGLDTLRDLLELLQGPFGLQEEEANQIVADSDPVFDRLQSHLNALASGEAVVVEETASAGLPSDFTAQTVNILKQMLKLFKQKESSASRQKLGTFCQHLNEIGGDANGWSQLLETARKAIENPANPYKVLAPFAIREIKQASETIAANPQATIKPSYSLTKLTEMERGAWSGQIIISADPKAAAQTLIAQLNKKQLIRLAKTLYKAAQ
ncbi:MAG: Hpt domain-containing protein [Cyanobacteriota bacterium]|nr:Hpt domain-containing protein [Cyanobacteriota bacterium]